MVITSKCKDQKICPASNPPKISSADKNAEDKKVDDKTTKKSSILDPINNVLHSFRLFFTKSETALKNDANNFKKKVTSGADSILDLPGKVLGDISSTTNLLILAGVGVVALIAYGPHTGKVIEGQNALLAAGGQAGNTLATAFANKL